jgi:hypothetical protein
MKPKEKAKELLVNFYDIDVENPLEYGIEWKMAKQCALIAVDEILRSEPRSPSDIDWDDVGGTHQYYYEAQREEADNYWQEVKQEIEKL